MPTILLILPTGTYRAEEYLAAAHRLGVEVVTGSERPQALASTMAEHFVELPLDDPPRAAAVIAEHGSRIHLDAILAVDDEGLLAAAMAAESLGLDSSPVAAVALTRDKAAMRAALAAAGVPQPDYEVVRGSPPDGGEPGNPDEVAEAAVRLGFPVVVKPTSLSGSRGVIRADSAAEARAAAERIFKILAAAREPNGSALLVERFVPGPEVALEGVMSGGGLDVLTIFDKPDPLDGPYFEETFYLSPSHLSPALQGEITGATRRAVSAMGLTEGPVHVELRVPGAGGASSGQPVAVLEVAARTIGGRCSKALVLANGWSLEELVIARLVGLEAPPTELAGPAGVLMIPIPSSGKLASVAGTADARGLPHVTGVEITVPLGRRVRALPEGDRYLGFVFAAAPERDLVEAALRSALELLVVEIEPEPGHGVGRPPVR
ncbi:MAG: ATP-grasp domain-containing protein [Acidimicrobiales bacterium]